MAGDEDALAKLLGGLIGDPSGRQTWPQAQAQAPGWGGDTIMPAMLQLPGALDATWLADLPDLPFLGGVPPFLVQPAAPPTQQQQAPVGEDEARRERTRQKNREARQRFRERQRQHRELATQQHSAKMAEADMVAAENSALAQRAATMERMLAVRDAVMQCHIEAQAGLAKLGSTSEQQLLKLQEAGRDLSQAIHELPSEAEVDALGPDSQLGLPGGPQLMQGASEVVAESAAVKLEGAAQGEGVPQPPPAAAQQAPPEEGAGELSRGMLEYASERWKAAADAHESVLDGHGLEQSSSIPPAGTVAVREAIAAMQQPGELLQYWREWQADLCRAWQAAEHAGFNESSVQFMLKEQDRMTEIWWHAAHLKPAFLTRMVLDALPPDSASYEQWEVIAADVLPELTAADMQTFWGAWQRYSKRLAKAAAGVRRTVEELQQLRIPDQMPGMTTMAAQSLELARIAARVSAAVQEEYLATMAFIGEQAPAFSPMLKAAINVQSSPYMPDVVAIVYHILRLGWEQGALQLGGAQRTQEQGPQT